MEKVAFIFLFLAQDFFEYSTEHFESKCNEKMNLFII